MKINTKRLNIILAERCKTASILHPGISPHTIRKIKNGCDIRPDVVGRVAAILCVPVEDIIEGGDHE